MKKNLAIKILLALLPAIIFTQDWAWMSSNRVLGVAFIVFWILMIWQVISSEDKNFVLYRLLWLSEIAFFLLPVSAIILTFSAGSEIVSQTEGIAQAGAVIGTAIGGFFAVIIGLVFGLTGGFVCRSFSKKYEKKVVDKGDKKDFFVKTRAWSFWLGLVILIIIAVSANPVNSVSKKSVVSPSTNGSGLVVERGDSEKDIEIERRRMEIEEIKNKIKDIEVTSTKIEKDILGTPNLVVSLKNNTAKIIDGINIEARFLNNFNEEVKGMDFDNKPFGGTSQKAINPAETVKLEWMLVFYDGATKVEDFKITRIHFTDGEDWNIE